MFQIKNLEYRLRLAAALALALIPAAVFIAVGAGGHTPARAVGTYAALIVDEEADENELCRRLEAENIRVIASSNQTACLNVFSGIEEVPLSEYFNRIESYDPRNDGYAQKALSYFVSGGKRRLYLTAPDFSGSLEARAARALDGLAGELIFPGLRSNSFKSIAIFALCSALFLLRARSSARKRRDTFFLYHALAFLPPMFVLALAGGAAIAACAPLVAVFQLLRAPLKRVLNGTQSDFWLERLKAEVYPALSMPLAVVLLLYVLIAAAAGLSAITASFALLSFFTVFFALSYAESCYTLKAGRSRFVFIPIRQELYRVKKFPSLPLPFAAGAFLSFFLSFFTTGEVKASGGDLFPARLPKLTADDFKQHVEFQRRFSFARLGNEREDGENGAESAAYLEYAPDADELIIGVKTEEADTQPLPQWKLAALVSLQNGSISAPIAAGGGGIGELVAALLALGIYIPVFVTRRRKTALPSCLSKAPEPTIRVSERLQM
ncbi:MAG: hypothetical protein LBC77_08940 [Spirochaetaceae bacterium]|jgi:hypothetical protein|nr:hypothetical protein [Spirochaetaceae bacterium]